MEEAIQKKIKSIQYWKTFIGVQSIIIIMIIGFLNGKNIKEKICRVNVLVIKCVRFQGNELSCLVADCGMQKIIGRNYIQRFIYLIQCESFGINRHVLEISLMCRAFHFCLVLDIICLFLVDKIK